MHITFKIEPVAKSTTRVRISARIDTGSDEQSEMAVQLLLGRPSKANHQMLPSGMLGYSVYAKDMLGKWWSAEVKGKTRDDAVHHAQAVIAMMRQNGVNMGPAPQLPADAAALVARKKIAQPEPTPSPV